MDDASGGGLDAALQALSSAWSALHAAPPSAIVPSPEGLAAAAVVVQREASASAAAFADAAVAVAAAGRSRLRRPHVARVLELALLVAQPGSEEHARAGACLEALGGEGAEVPYALPPRPTAPPAPAAASTGPALRRVHAPSTLVFERDFLLPRLPCVLTGVADGWPALTRWGGLDYLLAAAGQRWVPVETGERGYSHPDAGTMLLPLASLLRYGLGGGGEPATEEESSDWAPLPLRGAATALFPLPGIPPPVVACPYLAQYPLLSLLPSLARDVVTPDYTCCGEGAPVRVHAWVGPPGSLSSLHWDEPLNLLVQVVGSKRIRLYSPAGEGREYYAHPPPLSNTSRVDPEALDIAAFPAFPAAPDFDVLLRPGESLFIPPRWWHHVRGLEGSISVSFWWGADRH
jgi:hypothetical protein